MTVQSSPVVLALDTPDLAVARRWADAAGDAIGLVKVGLELFTAAGPDAVRALVADGHRVMLDLKLHDIPNTVAAATRNVAGLGAELLTVHALGGPGMLTAAVEAAGAAGPDGPVITAVTVLTSMTPADLDAAGLPQAATAVPALAALAARCGAGAIVCSPLEAAAVRAAVGDGVRIICPGVRPAGGDAGDQARIATPAGAVAAGADLLVVGRPITGAPDPAAAAAAIAAEATGARGTRRPHKGGCLDDRKAVRA
jgi:orotidine-5'-phosphate decarboxylase